MDKEWKNHAAGTLEELEKVNAAKASKDQFLLYGASLAIQDHMEREAASKMPATATEGMQEPPEHTPGYYATDELKAADEYHRMGLNDMAQDELRHAEYWIKIMRKEAYSPEQQAAVRDAQTQHDLMAQMIG